MIRSDTGARLEEITESLINTISPKVLTRRMAAAAVQIIRLLAKGQAVAVEQVAVVCSLPRREAAQLVQQFQAVGLAELDGVGSIVGLILSLQPTPHHFRVDGKDLYAWCAIDTLFLPAILGQLAEVESVCPVTGARIELRVKPDVVENVKPSGVALSLVGPGCTPGVTACCGPELVGSQGAFCNNVLFFSSRDAASSWLPEHPGAVILPVSQAFELARSVWSSPFLASLEEVSV